MKYLSIVSLIISLAVALALYQLWDQSSAQSTELQSLQQHNEELAAQLKASQDELNFIRQKLLQMENNSLKGIADKANNAFLDGWESLIGIVGKEIDEARKNLEQQKQPQGQKITPSPERQPDDANLPKET